MKTAEEVAKQFLKYWEGGLIPVGSLETTLRDYAEEQGSELVNAAVDLCNAARANAVKEARRATWEEAAQRMDDHGCSDCSAEFRAKAEGVE